MPKIGIIVHSHTGNTLEVAQKLYDRLLAAGHLVVLERVSAINEDPSMPDNVQLEASPDVDQYEVLFFGAPVRGFALSPVMKAYLAQIQPLQGKKVGCFVTEYFPYPWMGGNRAIRQMTEACVSKKVEVFATGVINWSSKKRDKQISELTEKLSRL